MMCSQGGQPMTNNLTEIMFILDRSGSMSGLESDTIGGFNALIKKQKENPDDAAITTVLFDDEIKVIHHHTNIRNILPMTEEDYQVRGTTALLDAVGQSIINMDLYQKELPPSMRAKHVMIVITTDGLENASRHFTHARVKQLIERQKALYNWEFIFLGANMDALSQARSFGIHEDKAVRFHSDKEGTSLNYDVLNEAINAKRANKTITKEWKQRIEKDFDSRK
jgi:uncharacterized protein YegL